MTPSTRAADAATAAGSGGTGAGPGAVPVHRYRRPATDVLLRYFSVLVYLFLFTPVIVILIHSFNNGRLLVAFSEFGFDAYTSIWNKPAISSAIIVSLKVSIAGSLIATVLGTLGGIALARRPGKWAVGFVVLLLLVAITPEIVDAVALLPWLVFLGQDAGMSIFNDGIVRLSIGNSLFSVAVVTYLVRARLVGMPAGMEEASADLGASPVTTFRRITLPLAMPGVLAGLLLSFTFSLDETVVSSFVQVSGTTPWPVYVLSAVKSGLRPDIAAVSTLMLVLTLASLAVIAIVLRRAGDSTTQIASTIAGG